MTPSLFPFKANCDIKIQKPYRKHENGLAIPGTFKAVTRSRRLGGKLYEELIKVKQLCAQMGISIKEMRSKPVRL